MKYWLRPCFETFLILFRSISDRLNSIQIADTEDAEETGEDTGEDPQIEVAKVVINEISIDPTDTEDWIEFYNPTTEDAEIGEWLIGDDLEELYSVSQLSADIIVPAGGFLAIYTKIIDENEEELGFGIKKDGTETLFLLENGVDGDVEEIIIHDGNREPHLWSYSMAPIAGK